MRSALTAILFLLSLSGDDPFDRFLTGARSPEPARRREALEAVLADPGLVPADRVDRAVRVLLDLLADHVPDLRGRAAQALAAFRSTETDLAVVHRLAEEADPRAQRRVIAACSGLVDETTIAWVVKRIWREPAPDVRALLVEALGMSPAPAAREELLRLAGLSLPWPVLMGAAIALGRHPVPEAVDRLVDLLWSEEPGVPAAAHESLVRLTGKRDLPIAAKAWVEWWAGAKEGFVFPGSAPAPAGEVRTLPPEPVTLPTYYDIPIRGTKVVFCLDVSASMWGPKEDAAKVELARAVRSLPTTCEFGVIFFNERPFPWRPDLVPAYPYQKLACVTDFETLTTKMYTNLFDTLETALGYAGLGRYAREDPPGVDDVFLVTDGEPNRGRRRDEKGILAGLSEIDPDRRVRIHAVSIGEAPRALLVAIAAARGGRHVHVPAAK